MVSSSSAIPAGAQPPRTSWMEHVDPNNLTMGLDLDNSGHVDQLMTGPLGIDVDNDGVVDLYITPEQIRELIMQEAAERQPPVPQEPAQPVPTQPMPTSPPSQPKAATAPATVPAVAPMKLPPIITVAPAVRMKAEDLVIPPSVPMEPAGPAPAPANVVVPPAPVAPQPPPQPQPVPVPMPVPTQPAPQAQPMVAPQQPPAPPPAQPYPQPAPQPMAPNMQPPQPFQVGPLAPPAPPVVQVGPLHAPPTYNMPSRENPTPSMFVQSHARPSVPSAMHAGCVSRAAPPPMAEPPPQPNFIVREVVERPRIIKEYIDRPYLVERVREQEYVINSERLHQRRVELPIRVSTRKVTPRVFDRDFPYHDALPVLGCNFVGHYHPATSENPYLTGHETIGSIKFG